MDIMNQGLQSPTLEDLIVWVAVADAAGRKRSPLLDQDQEQKPRTLRFMQQLRGMLNPLILQEVFGQTETGAGWGMANLLFTDQGPPAETLGFQGDYYLDTAAGVLYKKE